MRGQVTPSFASLHPGLLRQKMSTGTQTGLPFTTVRIGDVGGQVIVGVELDSAEDGGGDGATVVVVVVDRETVEWSNVAAVGADAGVRLHEPLVSNGPLVIHARTV